MYKEFILSASSRVTTEFGTNQHKSSWKVGNALIWRRNFQPFQLGAQVGTARGWGRPPKASNPHQSLLLEPEAAEAPFLKEAKQKSPG